MEKLVESKVFEIGSMESGRFFLNLHSGIAWERFPEYACKLLDFLNGVVVKKVDSFDIRVWEVMVQGETLRLVFDDFPIMVSLESTSESGDEVLLNVGSILRIECQ